MRATGRRAREGGRPLPQPPKTADNAGMEAEHETSDRDRHNVASIWLAIIGVAVLAASGLFAVLLAIFWPEPDRASAAARFAVLFFTFAVMIGYEAWKHHRRRVSPASRLVETWTPDELTGSRPNWWRSMGFLMVLGVIWLVMSMFIQTWQ